MAEPVLSAPANQALRVAEPAVASVTRRAPLRGLAGLAVIGLAPATAWAQTPASPRADVAAPGSGASHGSPSAQTSTSATPPTRYLGPDAVDLRAVLPPWPSEGSLGAAADLATVLNVQAMRTADDARWAREDGERDPTEWLTAGLGAAFAARAAPVLLGPLAGARSDFGRYAHRSPWPLRPRPIERDARVKPLMPVNPQSYPSARTAATRIWAEILAEVFPAERERLLAMAERSAWLRVVAGVHDPSDLEGGRRLALAFLEALRAQPSYRNDLEAARRAVS